DGLDHDGVGAAVDQALDRLAVGSAQLVEAGVAEAGIVDVRADRGGAAGRAEHADHEARPARGLLHLVAGLARQGRASLVELVDQVLEVVVGLADRGGVEGVGLDQVGAGLKVGAVDAFDDLGTGEQQQVVVALEVVAAARAVALVRGMVLAVVALGEALAAVVGLAKAMALDHRAHRAVDEQHAFAKAAIEQGDSVWMQTGKGAGHGRSQGFWAISEISSKCGGRRSRVTVSRLVTTSPDFSANRRSSLAVKPRLTWP